MINKADGCRCLLFFHLWAVMSFVAAAETGTSKEQPATVPLTERLRTELSTVDKARAARWLLEEDEWRRYRSLLQGIRGSVSPATLSPIEVLGIHARDPQERRRYAERWAMLMREDAERILAFQQAYDEAQQRLFPASQLIDTLKLRQRRSAFAQHQETKLTTTDRVLFFTEMDCVACDTLFDRLLTQLPMIAGMDVYLLDTPSGDEAAIRQWAEARRIKPEWVRSRRITLNFDDGALKTLSATHPLERTEPPLALRRRDNVLTPLSGSDF